MKTYYIIIGLLLSFNVFSQEIEGNTENGEGKYQYSNGATYSGMWENGKRHGKGVMTYPKGANEANTVKQKKDTTETCICSAWSPEISIATEEKIWKDMRAPIEGMIIGQLDIVEHYTDIDGKHLTKTRFSPGHFINAYDVVNFVIKGEYKKAAQKASDWGLGTAFPVLAGYKTLLEASAFTINIVIENWMNELYILPIYQYIDELVADEITDGDRDFNAYIFSGYVRGNPTLRKEMLLREERMFNRWNEIFENQMYVSIARAGQGENIFAKILYKVKDRYPKNTAITSRMIFNELMWISAHSHKDQMLKIFSFEMEIRAEEQALKLRTSMVKSLCKPKMQTKKVKKII